MTYLEVDDKVAPDVLLKHRDEVTVDEAKDVSARVELVDAAELEGENKVSVSLVRVKTLRRRESHRRVDMRAPAVPEGHDKLLAVVDLQATEAISASVWRDEIAEGDLRPRYQR